MFGWFENKVDECFCPQIIIAHRDPSIDDKIQHRSSMWVNRESKDIFSVTYDENKIGSWVKVGSFKGVLGKHMAS